MTHDAHLVENIFASPSFAATRDGFGTGIVEAARADPRIVVLSADLSESTRCEAFAKEFPERFVQVGVAEQNMAAVASGMAAVGKKPFITSYAMFSPGRNWEQVRTTIALNDMPVVICGMHAGVSVGPDGATHQALEDIAIMRVLPNMTVISPCDAEEASKATLWAAKAEHPVYIRFGREKTPVMTTAETPFEIGKAWIAHSSQLIADSRKRIVLIATGPLLYQALLAAHALEKEEVAATVVNVHSIKPLDEETIVALAKECGAIVTVEEHQVAGGLGGAIAELVSTRCPLPIACIGVQDRFGQSGTMAELYEEYGLTASHIVDAAKKVVARKQ